MNSMIENLVIDMRQLGIRSLAIELDDTAGKNEAEWRAELPTVPPVESEPAPEVEPEFRGDPNQCAVEGCGEPNGGVLGGKQKTLCRKHAFAKLGIK